jgi:hypothetical protein
MCQSDPTQLETLVRQAVAGTGAHVGGLQLTPAGSRRRRLWELDGHAHCPVVGVCLPISVLRRVINKAVGGQAVGDDYEMHCAAIAECKRRSVIAEAAQKELDRRYMVALRQAAPAKTTEALAAWWREASSGKDVAGALWAVLTHARCDSILEHRVLGEVHMLQHQVGMAARVDLGRVDALEDENAVLARELAAAQQRCTRQAAEHARQADQRQTELVRLRADLLVRDTSLAQAREQLAALEAAAPGLNTRFELAREAREQAERIHALQRTLLQAQQEGERQRRRADEAIAEWQHRDGQRATEAIDTADADTAQAPASTALAALQHQAVLCVGGRTSIVPVYRQLVERIGGRFMHHDGGDEDGTAKLDSTLAAADLVICQTGCISHDAYWRVKDHCKRTGKRCVFVDTPSRAGLERALGEVQAQAASREGTEA